MKKLERLKTLIVKYREILLYLIFGVLTTLVNYLALWFIKDVAGVVIYGGRLANAFAWVAAVLFAFITNKIYVFESKSRDKGSVMRETLMFYTSRLFTLGVETAVLWAGEKLFGLAYFWLTKVAASVIVVILNYILSKLLVFTKKWKKEN